MTKFLLFLAFIFISSLNAVASEKTVFGFVSDSQSNERLVGATVIDARSRKGTATNQFGFFSLTVNSDSAVLKIRCIGYAEKTVRVAFSGKAILELQIPLDKKEYSYDLVLVEGQSNSYSGSIKPVSMDIMNIEQIKKTNGTGGEPDLLKSVQLQPGVSFIQEGSTDYFVRGGGNDQNLVLLDGAPVYNPSHMFGFLGAFNLDAIKSAEFYRGYSPPRFGGKLSSVLNLTMKEGNRENIDVAGGISIISSRLKIEGPIGRSGSFLIAGRRSYFDLVLPGQTSNGSGDSYPQPDIYFYDLNAKLNFQVSENDKLYVGGYFGRDAIEMNLNIETNFRDGTENNLNSLSWGNQAYNLRWNHIQNEKLFFNTAMVFSEYYRNWSGSSDEIRPSVANIIIQTDAEYFYNSDNSFFLGGSYNSYRYEISSNVINSNDKFQDQLYSQEFILHASHHKNMFDFLNIDYGFRYIFYMPENFNLIEPRFSSVLTLYDNAGIKLSFSRNYQQMHMLSSVLAGSGINQFFYPSTDFLKPQKSDQIVLGTFIDNFPVLQSVLDFSLEGYLKKISGMPLLIDDKKGYSKQEIESNIDFGESSIYGIELQIDKRNGAINGYANYTYSVLNQNFKSVNDGFDFKPKFDRSHYFNAVVGCNINEKWNAGILFVLASGYLLPVPEYYFISGQSKGNRSGYGAKVKFVNSKRLDVYNRMDLNITYSFKFFTGDWNFFLNIYNIYNHFNPTFLFPDVSNNSSKFKVNSIGILPTIGLEFKF